VNLVVGWLFFGALGSNVERTNRGAYVRLFVAKSFSAVLSVVVMITAVSVRAQQEVRLPSEGRDSYGEWTSAMFDTIIDAARRSGEPVFVISRLGEGDAARMNARRLHNAVTRLVDYEVGLPHEQVVAAIGQQTNGPGLVEVFVGGRLYYRVTFRPNRDFVMDCCERDDEILYYPRRRAPAKYHWP
jgi:hypothetical protein